MYRLIILLVLLVGVLYSLHLLVQDYQALTAAPKLLRFLFKRDLRSSQHLRGSVRWRRILQHDPIQCARYLYCDLGARPPNNSVGRGFVYMLTLKPHDEDLQSLEYFQMAYHRGQLGGHVGFVGLDDLYILEADRGSKDTFKALPDQATHHILSPDVRSPLGVKTRLSAILDIN
ncbi:uncharacterized protein LOC114246085 [Bombyx mandarina]|uniref:Uncharacterized protein LOC114246085 n=1 Tax=Bombyx mandarina TaxID=7092 RepID=A0A6J2JXW2_BOMMA|nr:uncharacterized protein LOC114246085 [Bombyx mandarina]